jgi:hypothetical protein
VSVIPAYARRLRNLLRHPRESGDPWMRIVRVRERSAVHGSRNKSGMTTNFVIALLRKGPARGGMTVGPGHQRSSDSRGDAETRIRGVGCEDRRSLCRLLDEIVQTRHLRVSA